jgi:hypothetical protein
MKKPTAPARAARLFNPPSSCALRIEDAAAYSGLSPFYVEELIRSGRLLSIGSPGSGVSAAHIVLREQRDELLDELTVDAKVRAAKKTKVAA